MPYSENEPITTKDVLDAIIAKNWDGARDKTQKVLYNKSSEVVKKRKIDIANNIAKSNNTDFDVTADVIDAPTTVEPVTYEQEPSTGE